MLFAFPSCLRTSCRSFDRISRVNTSTVASTAEEYNPRSGFCSCPLIIHTYNLCQYLPLVCCLISPPHRGWRCCLATCRSYSSSSRHNRFTRTFSFLTSPTQRGLRKGRSREWKRLDRILIREPFDTHAHTHMHTPTHIRIK